MRTLETIIADIRKLENELLQEMQKKQDEYYYIIEGKRVKFEEETRRYHKTLAKTLRRYFADASLGHIVTAPLIYFCFVPAIFMDAVVTIYQAICFRVYRIPRVNRSEYIVLDRHSLQYLNAIEKLNCVYCGYFNGLVAYAQEIAARTEQYWCPIKHARKLATIHSRYHKFIEYGDGTDYQNRLEALRDDFDDLRQRQA
ncbi:MAG: hypothetical protein OEO19_03490 [Gammaproteobacteria bacterium]|nr:hypothetical protein [Gammaproteobacteria bacterium]